MSARSRGRETEEWSTRMNEKKLQSDERISSHPYKRALVPSERMHLSTQSGLDHQTSILGVRGDGQKEVMRVR